VDVNKDYYVVPDIDIHPDKTRALMVSEAPPIAPQDYFYAEGEPFYMQTTAQAFKDAGYEVTSLADVLDLGVYITTAIKCGKTGYSISSRTVENCSRLLERELDALPHIKAILLMGDTAIKAMNYTAKRTTGKRIVPSGATYKLRRNRYFYEDVRVIPTYLQTGKSYLIEKSKRKMIAEDIGTALR
jgi:uracil-DNA glycosylase